MTEERWHHCPWVGAVDSEDRVVVMDLDAHDPTPLILDGVAAAIWRALAEPITTRDLVRELAEAYAAPPGQVASDVEAFLDQLKKARLACTGDHPDQSAGVLE